MWEYATYPFIMLRNLPSEHPPLKGCVNLKPIKEVMALDFNDWETDEEDLMIVVDIQVGFFDEDWQFVNAITAELEHYKNKPTASSYLPVRLQAWFNENELTGDWFYDSRGTSTQSHDTILQNGLRQRKNYRIFFQYSADALMFKLRWAGE